MARKPTTPRDDPAQDPMSDEALCKRLLGLADCDARSGEPLGKAMREAAARIRTLTQLADAMAEALERAKATFERYATSHWDKAADASTEPERYVRERKAQANTDEAYACEQALSSYRRRGE